LLLDGEDEDITEWLSRKFNSMRTVLFATDDQERTSPAGYNSEDSKDDDDADMIIVAEKQA
jgi:hypothetical protein